MNDKLNITIRIANQAPIPLSINRDDEEVIRTAEFNVNNSCMVVLALVAFRFAELFFTQNALAKNAEEALAGFEETLDKILVGLPDSDEPGA